MPDPRQPAPINWSPKNNSKHLEFCLKLIAEHVAVKQFEQVSTKLQETVNGTYVVRQEVWSFQKAMHSWAKRAGRRVKCTFNKHTMAVKVELLD